jgi:hypothetical protein
MITSVKRDQKAESPKEFSRSQNNIRQKGRRLVGLVMMVPTVYNKVIKWRIHIIKPPLIIPESSQINLKA